MGQGAHKHQVFRDIQFFGEGIDIGGRKFSSTGLIFDLEIGVQFPEDLDIAMDIEVCRGVLIGIEPEDENVLAVFVAA